MEIALSADLNRQVELEISRGAYRTRDELIEEAVRHFFDDRHRSELRRDALRLLGDAVDEAGLYERVLLLEQ